MDFSHRLLSTISYAIKTGIVDGDITWSAPTTCKTRLVQRVQIVASRGGQELTSTHYLWSQTDIPEGARVWLPGADTSDPGEAYSVLSRKEGYTLDGTYTAYVLYLGR